MLVSGVSRPSADEKHLGSDNSRQKRNEKQEAGCENNKPYLKVQEWMADN
jgi:hypothetical protein